MFLCDETKREEYIELGDPILFDLYNLQLLGSQFISHKWLLDSVEKRMIYHNMYGDIIESSDGKVLDVGGGYCSLSSKMINKNDYHLLDIMAHDSHEELRSLEAKLEKNFWINKDWNLFDINDDYDTIIANDLFPNVDQRLESFLNKYLPWCHELRLSLTYYDNDKSYKVKRIGADEIFYIIPWDGTRLLRTLDKYKDKICDYNSDIFKDSSESIFANGRKVCILKIRGNK